MALEIQAAYDITWRTGLLAKIELLSFDKYRIECARGFSSCRASVLEMGAASLEVCTFCGVPQASPTSHILFEMFISDLEWFFRINRHAFVDDFSLWIVNIFRDVVTYPHFGVGCRAGGALVSQMKSQLYWNKMWVYFISRVFFLALWRSEISLCGECLLHVSIWYKDMWFWCPVTWSR